MKHRHNDSALRVLAWESTRACTLACPHCRASAVETPDSEELSAEEAYEFLESAAEIGSAIVILSGGEPLLRNDLEDVARKAIELGHRPVVSCNDGSLLTDQRLDSLNEAGIRHFSFSMHSAEKEEHDRFVRVDGAYDNALGAFERIRNHGMSFQINTTVLPGNYDKIAEIKDWVISLKASSWHLFFIVPTGRARNETAETRLNPKQVNEVLRYVAAESDNWPVPVKVTCAPQYARIRAEMGKISTSASRSCMAGKGFVFISYRGEVKPCGYFDLVVGNIRETPLDKIYLESPELNDMRNADKLTGICGRCRYRDICGGCRARALSVNGHYLADDPNCDFATGKVPD